MLDRLSEKGICQEGSSPKIYKRTWAALEFMKTVSYYLEILCMLCEYFLSKGHHPNLIQNIFAFNEFLLYLYSRFSCHVLFWNWYTYFKIEAATLTANNISVSQEDPVCVSGEDVEREIKCRSFYVSVIRFLGL